MACFGSQCFDDPAVGNRALAALADQLVELAAQCAEICNFLIDLREMRTRDGVDGTARAIPIVGKGEELAHLIEREAQVARAADKGEPGEMVAAIIAVIARSAPGLGKQSDLLVETNGFDLGRGDACQFADLHGKTA